jgi:hypothetical protein
MITYDDGEAILRRYNDKTKMWVTLRFAQEEDPNLLPELENMAVRLLHKYPIGKR